MKTRMQWFSTFCTWCTHTHPHPGHSVKQSGSCWDRNKKPRMGTQLVGLIVVLDVSCCTSDLIQTWLGLFSNDLDLTLNSESIHLSLFFLWGEKACFYLGPGPEDLNLGFGPKDLSTSLQKAWLAIDSLVKTKLGIRTQRYANLF